MKSRLVPLVMLNDTIPNACWVMPLKTPLPEGPKARLPNANNVFALMFPVVEPPAVGAKDRSEIPVEPAVMGAACRPMVADRQIASTNPKKIAERFIFDFLNVVANEKLVRVDREKKRTAWLAFMQIFPFPEVGR